MGPMQLYSKTISGEVNSLITEPKNRNAGVIATAIKTVTDQTHYFLKLISDAVNLLISAHHVPIITGPIINFT
jgi:hypothetical protein